MCIGIYSREIAHLRLVIRILEKRHIIRKVFQGAPLRLPKPLSGQFPVRVCSCPLCIINRLQQQVQDILRSLTHSALAALRFLALRGSRTSRPGALALDLLA